MLRVGQDRRQDASEHMRSRVSNHGGLQATRCEDDAERHPCDDCYARSFPDDDRRFITQREESR